ncbi:ribokinase [Allocoleopsis franciscana]|uniref:Ribokinase n=1 Tax=Allocoleopsis franciscana PCC 7113 TaxID=1173027 RepID=K9WIT3_9CYAN|nr:ribokinase [Allocoleopsis franciscana]AFZ20325.1 sugar kinase, ribokinase [Allocoleopsis franciscana PCC 7113]
MSQGVVISLGSINADFQVRVDRQPDLSKGVLLAHDFVRLGGGKAANVAYLASRLGISTRLIGHVGDDDLKEQALRSLREIDIDLQYVQAVAGQSTAVSMIAVPPDGKKGVLLAGNANYQWSEEDVEMVSAAIESAPSGSVLVVDYEITPFIANHGISAAHERGIPVILDPSPVKYVDQSLFSQISYIVPDAQEAKQLTGIAIDSVDHAVEAGRYLVEQGVKNAFVKLKDGGCVLVNSEQVVHIPPTPVDVVDATGAGDAFAGGLAVAVVEGKSLLDAACLATAASHAAVTQYGSQPAYPTRTQLDALFEQIVNHAHVL